MICREFAACVKQNAAKHGLPDAAVRRLRVRNGENCYEVYMPERFDGLGIVIKPWTHEDEREYLNRQRADAETLAALYLELVL